MKMDKVDFGELKLGGNLEWNLKNEINLNKLIAENKLKQK